MFNKTNIILAMIVCLLMICNLIIYNNKYIQPAMANDKVIKEYQEIDKNIEEERKNLNGNSDRISDEQLEQERLTDLKSMGEADRMYNYLGDFISKIEEEEYEEAYTKLYEDFRNQYFPTIDEFIEYVKTTYPAFIIVDYNDIERQGEYYIMTVTIKSASDSIPYQNIQQKFVLYEKDLNDYQISFQVM